MAAINNYRPIEYSTDGNGGGYASELAARRAKFAQVRQPVYTPQMPEPMIERIVLTIDGDKVGLPFCSNGKPDQSYTLLQFGDEAILKIGTLKHEGKTWFYLDDIWTKLDRLSGLPMGRAHAEPRPAALGKQFLFEPDAMPFIDMEGGNKAFSIPPPGSFWGNNFSGPTSSRYTDGGAVASDVEILKNGLSQEGLEILLTGYKIYLTDPKRAEKFIENNYDKLIPRSARDARAYALSGHSILGRRRENGLPQPIGMALDEKLGRDGGVHQATVIQMRGNEGWRSEPGAELLPEI